MVAPSTPKRNSQEPLSTGAVTEIARELLASPSGHIKLDELVSQQLDKFFDVVQGEQFSDNGPAPGPAATVARVGEYEEATADLAQLAALMARWGAPVHLPTLRRILTQTAEAGLVAGTQPWVALSSLPALLVTYAAGAAAIAADRYEVVSTLYLARAGGRRLSSESLGAVLRSTGRMQNVGQDQLMKTLPGLQDKKTPFSEYMLAFVRTRVAPLLGLRGECDDAFDRFEAIHALTIFSSRQIGESHLEIGRFVWRMEESGGGPIGGLRREAESEEDRWLVTKGGLFGHSSQRFLEISKDFIDQCGRRRPWW